MQPSVVEVVDRVLLYDPAYCSMLDVLQRALHLNGPAQPGIPFTV